MLATFVSCTSAPPLPLLALNDRCSWVGLISIQKVRDTYINKEYKTPNCAVLDFPLLTVHLWPFASS